jgi:hypothetical protein
MNSTDIDKELQRFAKKGVSAYQGIELIHDLRTPLFGALQGKAPL